MRYFVFLTFPTDFGGEFFAIRNTSSWLSAKIVNVSDVVARFSMVNSIGEFVTKGMFYGLGKNCCQS